MLYASETKARLYSPLNASLIEFQNLYSVGLNYARTIVCILVSPLVSETPYPLSSQSPSLKSENCLRLPFQSTPSIYWFFVFLPLIDVSEDDLRNVLVPFHLIYGRNLTSELASKIYET